VPDTLLTAADLDLNQLSQGDPCRRSLLRRRCADAAWDPHSGLVSVAGGGAGDP
jgi:hypothetical protein